MSTSGPGQSSNMDDSTQGSKSSRAPKGKVWLDRLAVQRAKGIIKDVPFNSHGQPIGPVGAELQSYIGVLTRRHVRVSFDTWRDVPADTKDLIWDSVKMVFNVGDNWKKQCLNSANSKWRQWKSTIFTKHIEPFEEKPEMLYNPPPDSGIRKEDWKDFVISRMSEGSRKKNSELKKRRSNNKYPHHMSRKGYPGLREEMKKQGKLTGNPVVDRAIVWRQGREKKDEEFDEVTKPTIAKLDTILELHKEGSFSQSHPTDDILTQALGNPEHSGRVRGVGAYVTPSNYFNLSRGTGMGMGNIVQEMRLEFEKQMAEMSSKILELQQHMLKKEVEEKGSCSNKNMDANTVDDVDVVEVLHENINQIVRVSRSKEIDFSNKPSKLKATDIPKPLKMLHSYAIHALKNDRGIKIPIDKNVFGHEQVCHIFCDDIHNFCELEPLPATCLCAYTWFLYKECENTNLLDRFLFMNPYLISHNVKVTVTEKARIIGTRLTRILPNQLVLVPCNVGYHWILMVIDAHKETVFCLDPLRDETHAREWIDTMDTAIKMFNATIGKRGRQFILWESIMCQQQPDGKQCGFYVMRYMKDLIENFGAGNSLPIPLLFSEGFYSKREIDEVRKEWAEFVFDFTE